MTRSSRAACRWQAGSAKRDRAQTARRPRRASPWREGKPRGCAAPAV